MGAWSTRIFDNDIAMDILTEYRTMLGYKVSPEIAYAKIKDYFEKDFIGCDDEDDYWLALAYFQWKNGLLIDEVKENALKCLKDEKYLERWADSGAKVLEKRKQTLAEFKYNLENVVNPTKKSFPKPPAYLREKTPFKVGDIISYQLKKSLIGGGYEPFDKAKEFSKKLLGKYFILKVIDVKILPVSDLMPDLDYSSSAVFMIYDWIGDTKPDMNILSNLKFKKICDRIEWRTIDLDTMTKLEKPHFEKRICPAYYLGNYKDLCIGDKCEIDIIGTDLSTDKEKIDLWLEHPSFVALQSCFDITLVETFTEYDYPEVWD